MAMEVQERDVGILKYVFANRVVSYEQIVRRFFPNCHKTAGHRRIRKLCREGLLEVSVILIGKMPLFYVELTEKAWPIISHEWPFYIDRPHFKSESPLHDMRMGEIVPLFEKLTTFRTFLSENLLQSSTDFTEDYEVKSLVKLQSDGALILNGPDGHTYVFGIEFEMSKKSQQRYQDKLLRYYIAHELDGVIYICSSQTIINVIAKADEEIRGERDSIVHFNLEENVLKSKEKIYFKNAKEDGIELF